MFTVPEYVFGIKEILEKFGIPLQDDRELEVSADETALSIKIINPQDFKFLE